MDRERFQRVRRLHEDALDLPEADRPAFLEEACGDDDALRREVEQLLAEATPGGWLDPPEEWQAGAERQQEVVDQELPDEIGPYRIEGLIAAGGMGVVYEAVQDSPRRRVALKVLPPGLHSAVRLRRFQEEAQLLARLNHPGIAQVIEAGVQDQGAHGSAPYFAMELVSGALDLISYARRHDLGLREKLELFRAVCDAVHYGHQQGVIHRDLKTANVLVTEAGRPKVIDYGIARTLDADRETLLTREGELIGTLHTMAPEQLAESPELIGTGTDVYALGLLLYELLYSNRPYDLAGKPLPEVARIIREVPPRNPRDLRSSLPPDLGWIALHALEKEPRRRYSSVAEFARDVQRFLDHEPVEAGPPSAVYRMQKFVRRNYVTVVAAAVVMAALVLGAGLALLGLVEARTEGEKFQSINAILTDILVGPRAEEGGHDVMASELIRQADERIGREYEPEVEAPIRNILAQTCLGLGRPEWAEQHARRALDLYGGLVDETDKERLRSARWLGMALLQLDRIDEARAVTDAYLEAARSVSAESAHLAGLGLRLFHKA